MKTHLSRAMRPITACGLASSYYHANYDAKKVDCKTCMKTSFYKRELAKVKS